MEGVAEDPLFLAITRPPLVFGVPIEAAAICVMLGEVASLLSTGELILFFPYTVVAFLAARALSAKDPLIFAVLFSWLRTRPRGGMLRVTGVKFWGGVSMSPLRADTNEMLLGRA
jgi:type IV secretion system protein VirB3